MSETNTQNACPCGDGYKGCVDAGDGTCIACGKTLYPKASPDIKVPAFDKSSALDAPQVIPPISSAQLKRELETKPENKSVFTRIKDDPIFMAQAELEALVAELRQAHGALEQFQKAKEWNALCELELNNLRSRLDEAEEDMGIQGVRMGEAQETIYALKNALRELCEKMEAGISGEDETKRARALLEKLK